MPFIQFGYPGKFSKCNFFPILFLFFGSNIYIQSKKEKNSPVQNSHVREGINNDDRIYQ